MGFIEEERFHEKRRNLTVYERHLSILLAGSPDEFYWMGALSR
jgi:hypothetical protein